MRNQILQALAVFGAVAMVTNFVAYRSRQAHRQTAEVEQRKASAAVVESPTPDYLKALPESPSAANGTGSPLDPQDYEDYYYVECDGAMHTRVTVTGDFQAYNGIQGLIERTP